MNHRSQLIEDLKEYRKNYNMGYESAMALDSLVHHLEAEEADELEEDH